MRAIIDMFSISRRNPACSRLLDLFVEGSTTQKWNSSNLIKKKGRDLHFYIYLALDLYQYFMGRISDQLQNAGK